MEAFRLVMPFVLVERTVFLHVPQLYKRPHQPWAPKQVSSLNLHKDLLLWGIEQSVTIELICKWFWGWAESLIPLWSASFLLWILGHILLFSFVIIFLSEWFALLALNVLINWGMEERLDFQFRLSLWHFPQDLMEELTCSESLLNGW